MSPRRSSSPRSAIQSRSAQSAPFVPYKRPRISEDEKRLFPDYDIPPDAVALPDPSSYAYDQVPDMRPPKVKPGQDRSFAPMNTMDGSGFHKRNLVYGISTVPQMARGQLAFLEREDTRPRAPGSLGSYSLADYDSPHSPNKRRKMQHPASPDHEVIDLSGNEEEVVEVPPFGRKASMRSPPGQLSARSPSQRSVDLTGASNGRLSRPPVSAFQRSSALIDPRRKKGRRQLDPNQLAEAQHQFGRPSIPDQPIDLEDEYGPPANLDEDELHTLLPVVKSKHFAPHSNGNGSTRINHSTGSPVGSLRGGQASNPGWSSNLREKFQRTRNKDPIDDHDELAGPFMAAPARSRPSKRASPERAAAHRKTKNTSLISWALRFAQSYDLEVESTDLSLKHQGGTLFDIQQLEHLNQWKTLATIDLRKVRTAQADSTSMIRLEGSASNTGEKYWFDLTFANTDDFNEFCDTYVAPACRSGHAIERETALMEKLFKNKPRRKAHTEIADYTSKEDPDLDATQAQRRSRIPIGETPSQVKTRLVDQILPGRNEEKKDVSTSIAQSIGREAHNGVTVAGPPRSTRTTRNSRPSHGDEENHVRKEDLETEPIKYSVEHGLGEMWDKPVSYGSGRRRALVNFDDLFRLDEGEFLNDALIDFYMIYLFEQAKIPENKVYFFNTHFYTTLTRPVAGQKGAINYASVARWTRDVDIFNYDYIVVPVCEATHWYLAIICNVSNISRTPAEVLQASSPTPEPSEVQHGQPSSAGTEEAAAEARPAPSDTNLVSSHSQPNQDSGEDPNLFEEEQQRNAQPNPDNTVYDPDSLALIEEHHAEGGSPASLQTTRMEKLTIDDIPKGIIGETSGTASTPKKGKRKSGAHLKRYDPDEPIIIVLDSLGISHPKTIKVLKDYILEEGRAKRSMEATITQNALYVRDAHIPMQPNYTDCGVYLLAYVQKFFENPKRFVTRILTREMDRETDWPDMNASAIRHTMRNMLQSIAKKQREERKAQKKNKKGTSVATGNANAGAPVEASKPQLLPAIQLKKSAAATSPTDSAPATQERVPSRSPRKKSPKVVIPSVSHETRKSPKRSLDESNHDEAAEPRARNGLSQLDGPTSSPKRQKLDGEFRSDGPAEESTVGTRTSPRLAREPSTERMKMTPVPKSLPASRRELQVQSETLQVRNEDLGRSSAEPIEIEDSLDIIELGSDTKNRTRSLQQQRPPERTKASYSNKGQAGHGASIDLRSPKNAHSQSQYPRKVPIEVVDDTPREVTERQPSQRTAAARNSGLVGQGYQYIEDDDTTIQETPPPEEIAE